MQGTRRVTFMAAAAVLVAAGCVTGFAVTATASGNYDTTACA
jgi:hypothetical protein